METPCKQPGEVTKSSSTVLNRKPKQDCSKYGLTGSRLIPFAHIIQLLCFELHKARKQECFRNELYSFVQHLIPRTLSFFSKIVALVNELSCYNV